MFYDYLAVREKELIGAALASSVIKKGVKFIICIDLENTTFITDAQWRKIRQNGITVYWTDRDSLYTCWQTPSDNEEMFQEAYKLIDGLKNGFFY